MKKSFLMLGLAVAAMTSCTNDEVVEVNQSNLIKFESFVNKGTRAVEETTTSNLQKFYVYGSTDYSGTNTALFGGNANVVSKNGSTWQNSYNERWSNGIYSFVAYANEANGDPVTSVSYNKENQTLTISDYIADSSQDLIGAFVSNPNKYTSVSLTFKHMLTKVTFEFTNTYDQIANATMNITNLVVHGAKPQGTCTLNSSGIDWLEAGDATDRLYLSDADARILKEATYIDSHLFIPQALSTDINISFDVTYYDGANQIVTKHYENVALNGTVKDSSTDLAEWEPGVHYKYTASLPVDPEYITFTVTKVEGWDDYMKNVDDDEPEEDVDF